jgi:apocytochrome f
MHLLNNSIEMTLKGMNGLFSLATWLRSVAIAVVVGIMVITGLVVQAKPAAAYPFWAQENYETPREATGRIVCANCHLAEKPTKVEAPQAVLPDSVFPLKVSVPYDLDTQQVLGDGSTGGLNVGAVVVLPDGFTIAPPDRIPEDLKEEVGSTYFIPYSEDQQNIVLVGPLPGEQYQEIVFPVLAPNPNENSAISFGKYQVHVGGNRGRGQVYPTGQNTNNTAYNATASGIVTAIEPQEAGGYSVTIQTETGEAVTEMIPAGPALAIAEGDAVTAGKPITENPNVGGFGQIDTEIVLQSPNRIKGLIAFLVAVMVTQIMLVLKKKQVEKVQAAEMSF